MVGFKWGCGGRMEEEEWTDETAMRLLSPFAERIREYASRREEMQRFLRTISGEEFSPYFSDYERQTTGDAIDAMRREEEAMRLDLEARLDIYEKEIKTIQGMLRSRRRVIVESDDLLARNGEVMGAFVSEEASLLSKLREARERLSLSPQTCDAAASATAGREGRPTPPPPPLPPPP